MRFEFSVLINAALTKTVNDFNFGYAIQDPGDKGPADLPAIEGNASAIYIPNILYDACCIIFIFIENQIIFEGQK